MNFKYSTISKMICHSNPNYIKPEYRRYFKIRRFGPFLVTLDFSYCHIFANIENDTSSIRRKIHKP